MRRFKVLLVDDEELALDGLAEGVDWDGLRVGELFKALRKEAAVGILRNQKIDIVITDIEMPNGSGLELIRWLREEQPYVRSVIYTGHAEFSYAQEALRLGVEDYLLKPIVYHELERLLERVEKKIEAQEKDTVLSEPEEEPQGVSSTELVEQVKKLIGENLSQGNLQRDELAAMVHISPGYLGRIFKKETGMALTDFIIRKRIVMAKQFLLKTNLSITDISNRVGISYASYFTKLFREQVGVTPQEYRQQYHQQKG